MKYDDKASHFEALALPHLDAAYNLARWLTGNDQRAREIVQAAFTRAFDRVGDFRGKDARSWLLSTVRHAYSSSLRERLDVVELIHGGNEEPPARCVVEFGAIADLDAAAPAVSQAVNLALLRLPQAFREMVVLKEMEDFSYKEIAAIAGIPIATAMSRLARGRRLLMEYLEQHAAGDRNGLL